MMRRGVVGTAISAGLVIFAVVCSSGWKSLQRVELQGAQGLGFPSINSRDRHGWAPAPAAGKNVDEEEGGGKGFDENGEMTPEHQAKMQVEWERIMGSTNTMLEKEIAKGQEADRRLRDAMGPVHWARYLPPRPLSSSPACSIPASSSTATASPCRGAGRVPNPPDQIFSTPEVVPGTPVLVDPRGALEQRRLREEDEMAKELEKQGEKLQVLRRRMAERRQALESRPKRKSLWDGVHLTARDLEPKSKRQKKWEAHLWRKWDRENERYPRGNLGDMLRAVRKVAAARGSGADASDRAEQAEIGEVDGGERAMYWERDPDLHYSDLGPDGRPVGSEGGLGGGGAARRQGHAVVGGETSSSAAVAVAGEGAKAKRGGYSIRNSNPMCQFCGGGAKGAEKDQVTEHGGEVHGQKVFTRSDWDAAKRGSDFETTFPDTDDLRTLDWLGGEKEKPYTAEEDSMSAAGFHVQLPGDWDDFPKAKGTYTHYGIGPHVPPRWS